MSTASAAALQAAYTAVKNQGSWISLHTADPGTTGANEVAGSPYARVQAALPAGSNGSGTAPVIQINVPAGGVTVTHVGQWSAATGGTFQVGNAFPIPVPFAVAGKCEVTYSLIVAAAAN